VQQYLMVDQLKTQKKIRVTTGAVRSYQVMGIFEISTSPVSLFAAFQIEEKNGKMLHFHLKDFGTWRRP